MVKEKEDNLLGLGEKLSNERLSTGKRRWSTRVIVTILILILAGGGYLVMAGTGKAGKYEFTKVAKQDIRESVEITGNVEAGATINLTFRDSGQLEKINFELGDELKKGDVIASLKNRDQELRLEQARANLAGAQANLNERLAGSTNEDIRMAEVAVQQAEAAAEKVTIDWNNAKQELELIKKKYAEDEKKAQLLVDDAKNKYDYAVKNQSNTGLSGEQAVETAKLDLEAQLYSTGSQIQQSLINLENIIINDGTSVLGADLANLDYLLLNQAQMIYNQVKTAFDPMYLALRSKTGYETDQLKVYATQEQDFVTKLLQAQKGVLDALLELNLSTTLTEQKLAEIRNRLLADNASLSNSLSALNVKYQNILDAELGLLTSGDTRSSEVISAENYYQQQQQTYQQTVIDHQVDLNKREANIRSLQAQYQIQLAEIESAKAALQKTKAGPRPVDVAYLRTQVTANQIAVALAEEALEKTLLRAPMDGVLSRSNIDVGEDVVSSNSVAARETGVFEMISAQKFKIDAEIAEVDINKLKKGDKAQITLDAVGDDTVFTGTISKIDPVETVIQDVVFYKAEVVIESTDARIRPGMTANVEIVLREVKDALAVPEKAVQAENGQKYVRQLVNNQVINIPVETGIRDLQGNLEIKGKVKEGDEIILRTLNGK